MTRIAFIGDVHVANHKKFGGPIIGGINSRCENILSALSSAVTKARTEDAEALVILGDLFDTPRPVPQMVRRVQEIVEQIPTIILAGNHDQCSDSPGDNALAPLYPVAEIFDEPDILEISGVNLIMVPHHSGDYAEYLKDQTIDLVKRCRDPLDERILCFHAGVIDSTTPAFLRESQAAITREDLFALSDQLDIRASFAGHWHNARAWEKGSREIFQAGAFTPTGFGDQGTNYGILHVYETKNDSVEQYIVPGPRFVDVSLDQDITTISAARDPRLTGCALYVRMSIDEEDMALGSTIIKAGIDAGVIEDGEISINADRSKEACRKAARATTSAKNLEEALTSYTADMPLKNIDDLDEPEARMEILAMAIKYLRRTGAD
jgi:DNA repair exonuclease SbcCD nuclease subunit